MTSLALARQGWRHRTKAARIHEESIRVLRISEAPKDGLGSRQRSPGIGSHVGGSELFGRVSSWHIGPQRPGVVLRAEGRGELHLPLEGSDVGHTPNHGASREVQPHEQQNRAEQQRTGQSG
jgi:hypothetical protein